MPQPGSVSVTSLSLITKGNGGDSFTVPRPVLLGAVHSIFVTGLYESTVRSVPEEAPPSQKTPIKDHKD